MPKFFVTPDKISGKRIVVEGQDATHALRVLRLKLGEDVVVCDGQGNDYHARIISTSLRPELLTLEWSNRVTSNSEPEVRVILCQGMPKSDKMDLVIQKAVEIGALSIIPVITERIVALNGSNADKKVERWNRISMEAAKQCGRGIIPQVFKPVDFAQLLDMFLEAKETGAAGIMPWEEEKNIKLSDALELIHQKGSKEIWVFVGPEGGISREEANLAISAGMVSVTLGSRILRTETAGLTVLASIMYEYHEY